jgi:hypothetical protein
VIADRVGALFRRNEQLRRIGDELPGDRIVGVVADRSAAEIAGVTATA